MKVIRMVILGILALVHSGNAAGTCCLTCEGSEIPSHVELLLVAEDRSEIVSMIGSQEVESPICSPEKLTISLVDIDYKGKQATFRVYSTHTFEAVERIRAGLPILLTTWFEKATKIRCASGTTVSVLPQRLIPTTITESYAICGAVVSGPCGACTSGGY